MADIWISPGRQRPPGWQFSSSAANELARELTLTAQGLLDAASMIELDAPIVTEDWTGRFRDVYDVDSAQMNIAARSIAHDLLQTAATVRMLAEHALSQWEECE